jgi:hypothetical protein
MDATITLTRAEATELLRVLSSEPEMLADPSCDEEERESARELLRLACELLEAKLYPVSGPR